MKKNDTPFLDRVFLHSKNADERLFDMILRVITFIVLIIILWLYADLTYVHADDSQYLDVLLLGDNALNLQPYFNNSDWSIVKSEYPDTPYNSSIFGFVSEIPGHIILTSDMNIDDCYCAIGRCYWSGSSDSSGALFIDKDLAINNHVTLLYDGFIFSDSEISAYFVWVNKRESLDTSLYDVCNIIIPSGISEFRNLQGLQFGSTFYWYLSNLPMLNTHDSNLVSEWFISGDNTESVFNVNYLEVNALCVSPSLEEIESSKNHLAISDCQIGITAFDKELTDLSESSVVIGLACDDNWILSHENDYTVLVQYDFYLKDSNLSQADPVTLYTQSYPLSAFKTEPITESMANIMVNSMVAPFPSNRDFYSYYRSLNSTYGQKVVSERTFNYDGLIPTTIDKVRAFLIGSYSVTNEVTPNNTIFEFYLDVNVRLSAQGDSSGYFTKRFDFKRGTTSILSADAYHNSNPWEGESNPLIEYDPQVPAVGGGGSSSVLGGNTSVVVNNNGGKVPINVHNQTQLDDCIRRYNEVRQVFFADIQAIAADTGSNNFIRVLNEAMPQIPGMSIYMTYVSLICFVALILIVLKVLLF